MSLADVESASHGSINAVVLGSYERGDRTVSVIRLEELAQFYGVYAEDLVADLVRPSSVSAQLLASLRDMQISSQIADWHDVDSGARGVQIRLTASGAATLLARLASGPPGLAAHLEADLGVDGAVL
jgi:hypothetical protein